MKTQIQVFEWESKPAKAVDYTKPEHNEFLPGSPLARTTATVDYSKPEHNEFIPRRTEQ